MKNFLIVLFLFSIGNIFSQDDIIKKKYIIKRVTETPNIDAVLDDNAWKDTNVATDFVMFRPRSNEPEPNNIRTEVRIVYDDDAIYFGAYLHDDKPEEILMEFQTRDNFGNADFFSVAINPFNDGQNQTEFFVMSTGNQNDALVTPSNGEDFSWNAVWNSAAKVVDDGWIVEMKIPYSALRFSNDNIQTWGLNFHRHHRKNRDQYSWNFINREKGNISQYDGILDGIKNIKPPVRLSFNPFVTASSTSFSGTNDFDWSAGLDVKYGITENFTLDATLIPDFGQVAFDDVTLNLGPFEQRFSEQRAFFTEGTDLFNKGGLFESRRIGSSPIGEVITSDDEVITDFPSKVDVLNIIKVSGRTKKGLGIGVLNAVTEKTKATIENSVSGERRTKVIEPLTNYNVLVLDQQFNKNSSISIVNTNVTRAGHFRDANVTGLLYDLKTKNNKYAIDGGIAVSNVYNGNGEKPIRGYEGNIEIGKISGNHQYDFELEFMDEKYDKNDLGFQRRNNNLEFIASYSYRIFEPKGIFNDYFYNIWGNLRYLMKLDESTLSYQEKSNLFTGNRMGFNFRATTKKQFSFGFSANSSIGKQYDYFEPREPGRFYKLNPSVGINNWISTDFSKSFSINASYFYSFRYNETRSFFSLRISPRFRFNNKMTMQYSVNYTTAKNQKGYVNTDSTNNIIFGNRDSNTVTNSLSAKYNFNTKSSLSLTVRHFWSPVQYDDQFFKLENNGDLSLNNYSQLENNDLDPDNDINHDINFNTWNLDLNFNWEFAPGSQLIALYRNSIFNQDQRSQLNFTDNFDNLFKEDILHNFSIKLIYYLDYNQAKNWL
jgi:hypothetical protein